MIKHLDKIIYHLLVNLAVFIFWRASMFWYEYQQPLFFLLLLIIPLYSVWQIWITPTKTVSVAYTLTDLISIPKINWRVWLRHSVPLFRVAAIATMTVAFARPQSKSSYQNVNVEGIDICIAFDVSASMLAQDFKPNRLESSKQVALKFIEGRPNDRIGLVVYEGESFTQCPLTTDHRVLKELFGSIKTGMIEGGTAVGMGLATAVNRLRNSTAKSKIIILLTDGVNNAGTVPPLTAAEIAKEYGIRVYTIGVGTKGKAKSPVAIFPNGQYKFDYVDVDIDEITLREISQMTGAKYFRATNEKSLESIYNEIDKLEKTKIKVTEFSRKKEEYFWFLVAALVCLGLEFFGKTVVFRSIS